jgi:Kef-type K+ transport system membrane component KefB
VYSLLLSLAAVIIATKLLGELARRFGQPSVLGELLAGVILGGSALAVVDPLDPALRGLADLGVFVLLFQIGLRTDLRSLRRVGTAAWTVAGAGAVLPFVAGFLVTRALGFTPLAAVISGAALTATSMAISARVLGDARVRHTREGAVALGAALADDVIGLVVLSIVVALAARAARAGPLAPDVAHTAAALAAFIVLTLGVGGYATPPLFRVLDAIRAKGSLGMFGLAFGLLLAAIGLATGAGMVMGAFLAGAVLHGTPQRQEIERSTAQVGHFFVPVFFAVIGASVDLATFAAGPAIIAGASLIAAGVLGKVLAGYAPWRFSGNKALVGVAMVPRGEMGLIFAQMGLSTGAITPPLFAAIMAMVVVTTFLTPPLLHMVVARDDDLERDTGGDRDTPDARRQTATGRRHHTR